MKQLGPGNALAPVKKPQSGGLVPTGDRELARFQLFEIDARQVRREAETGSRQARAGKPPKVKTYPDLKKTIGVTGYLVTDPERVQRQIHAAGLRTLGGAAPAAAALQASREGTPANVLSGSTVKGLLKG